MIDPLDQNAVSNNQKIVYSASVMDRQVVVDKQETVHNDTDLMNLISKLRKQYGTIAEITLVFKAKIPSRYDEGELKKSYI